MPDEVVRIAIAKDSPATWHRLENISSIGGRFKQGTALADVIEQYRMNDELVKVPEMVEYDDGTQELTGGYALVSFNPDGRLILQRGLGNRYQPRQISELVDIFSPLCDDGLMPLETVGILSNWRIFWFLLNNGRFQIGDNENETYESYFGLVSRRDGKGADHFLTTNVRVVCRNTLNLALSDKFLTIPHYDDSILFVKFRATLIEVSAKRQAWEQQVLNSLFTAKVDDALADDFFSYVNPKPKKSRYQVAKAEAEAALAEDNGNMTDSQKEVMDEVIKNVSAKEGVFDWRMERYDAIDQSMRMAYKRFNDEYSYAAQTAYALLQGVTYFTSHDEDNLFTGGEEKALLRSVDGDLQEYASKAFAWGAKHVKA